MNQYMFIQILNAKKKWDALRETIENIPIDKMNI